MARLHKEYQFIFLYHAVSLTAKTSLEAQFLYITAESPGELFTVLTVHFFFFLIILV